MYIEAEAKLSSCFLCLKEFVNECLSLTKSLLPKHNRVEKCSAHLVCLYTKISSVLFQQLWCL